MASLTVVIFAVHDFSAVLSVKHCHLDNCSVTSVCLSKPLDGVLNVYTRQGRFHAACGGRHGNILNPYCPHSNSVEICLSLKNSNVIEIGRICRDSQCGCFRGNIRSNGIGKSFVSAPGPRYSSKEPTLIINCCLIWWVVQKQCTISLRALKSGVPGALSVAVSDKISACCRQPSRLCCHCRKIQFNVGLRSGFQLMGISCGSVGKIKGKFRQPRGMIFTNTLWHHCWMLLTAAWLPNTSLHFAHG